MLPWMCGRQTLTIVVSSPCMTQAQMIVAVVAARFADGEALPPLTPQTIETVAALSSILHSYYRVRTLEHAESQDAVGGVEAGENTAADELAQGFGGAAAE